MLITGILIIIVAIFMLLVPQFFMKLKSPRIPDKLLKNPKMKMNFCDSWNFIDCFLNYLITNYNI